MQSITIDRPKLSLGIKKQPLTLEAYRSKIGLPSMPVKTLELAPKKCKPKRVLAHASHLPWPARAALEPPVEIPGAPVPVEQTRIYKSAKSAEMAARLWARKIAWQVAQIVPEDRREDAERFVLRHRVSVLNAFHRRLPRADVVQFLSQLFASRAQGIRCPEFPEGTFQPHVPDVSADGE